ncbi:O-antigen ligase family protein [Paenibacillus albiflavus]|nr:O-antigen ligase family protein [Paenibacillus albiflavus]
MNSITLEGSAVTPLYAKLIWLLLILCAIVFIEPAPYDLFVLLAFGISLFTGYLRFPAYMGLPVLLIGLFVMSNVPSMLLVSSDQNVSIKYFMVTLYLIVSWLFFAGLNNRFKETVLKVIFSGYLTAAILSTVIGLLAYFHIIPTFGVLIKYGRVTGLFKDPNVFGPFLVPGVVISLHYMVTRYRNNMLIWMISFILLIVGVLLSFSRAAWGNCVLACCLYLLFPYTVSLKKKIVMISAILLIAVPIMSVVITSPNISSMFTDRFGIKKYDEDRFGTQQKALSQVIEHPLGIGPGQSEILFSYATHSLYVRVLIENGIVGFTAYISFILLTIYRAFYNAWRRGSPYHAYFAIFGACLVGIIFNSFFIDTLHWRHFWILLALPWMPNSKTI